MTAPAITTDSCTYCGLPLADIGRPPRRAAAQATERDCCLGCRWAAEVARERSEGAGCSGILGRLGLAVFLTLNVLVFTMALWTTDVYRADEAGAALDRPLAAVYRYLSLLLTLPVLWLLLPPLAESAWEQLRRHSAATDLLLLLGVVAATAYSALSVFRGAGPVYFEVACIVLLAVTLGRWFEATGKAQANRGSTLSNGCCRARSWLSAPTATASCPPQICGRATFCASSPANASRPTAGSAPARPPLISN